MDSFYRCVLHHLLFLPTNATSKTTSSNRRSTTFLPHLIQPNVFLPEPEDVPLTKTGDSMFGQNLASEHWIRDWEGAMEGASRTLQNSGLKEGFGSNPKGNSAVFLDETPRPKVFLRSRL